MRDLSAERRCWFCFVTYLGSVLTCALARDVPKLQEQLMVKYLRAGDFRLVRPTPSDITAERQQEIAGRGGIELGILALGSQQPVVQACGAEIIHLLTTNNPKNRADIAAAGAVPKLVELVKAGSNSSSTDDQVTAAEEAAEALWILGFAGGGEENAAAAGIHVMMAAEGAATALAELLLAHPSARAAMWAGAALGNLMAAYPRVPSKDSEAVRWQVLAKDGLVAALVANLQLRVKSDADQSLWPSQATKSSSRSPTIVAWGAGQALKNLALSEAGRKAIIDGGAVKPLCKLKASPDWLEALKGRATLENLGVQCGGEEL
mmetsp:Transcript_23965/g.44015  ORF Transcript_23965/g.44015 Transcript_23965/m.44015 type:complete len:320 (-) Transcript_23965:38-997(-)